MAQYVGCDVHRRYSVFRVRGERGESIGEFRIELERGELERFRTTLEPGSPVALEACGSWMWMADAIEKAGHVPLLADRGRLTNDASAAAISRTKSLSVSASFHALSSTDRGRLPVDRWP